MGAFRYPGAKGRIAHQILCTFPPAFRLGPLLGRPGVQLDYREPFFGAGGIGLKVIPNLPPGTRVWINDADAGIAQYWQCVLSHPIALSARVQACHPTVELYRECLARSLAGEGDCITTAFDTLFLHQCSYSGLGKKAGSPIGGWSQDVTPKRYDVACRWRPKQLVADIQHWHRIFANYAVQVTCGDFESVFADMAHPTHTFVYCDPPYVKRGAELYATAMTVADHERLATGLRQLQCSWVLSYDDDALIRQLYAGCNISPVSVRYTVTNGIEKDQGLSVSHELLIRPCTVSHVRQRWSIVVPGRTGYAYAVLARQTGLPSTTIRNRIRRGWPLERALSQPVRSRHNTFIQASEE